MKEREREGFIVAGVLAVLLAAWLGFFLHRSPRFPGSGVGAIFGIAGAVLMLVPLAYTIAKRFPSLNVLITRGASMKTLLALHIYAGLLGPLLAIIHTGHKFDSWLGMILTALMLLVAVSGFAVRYALGFVAHEIKDQLALLQTARGDLDNAWGALEASTADKTESSPVSGFAAGMALLGLKSHAARPTVEITRIAESVADLELSVSAHELFQAWFSRSLKLHIVLSVIFYVLLALHITAGVQYGLRWFT